MSEKKQYYVEIPLNTLIEYDRQNDVLYIYLDPEQLPEEEYLSEDGDLALGFKDGKLVVIQVFKFSEKIGAYIL